MCGNHLRKQGVCQQDVSFYLANKTYTKYWSFPSHIVKHLPPTKNTIKRNWASDFLKNPMNISNSKVILNQENKDRGPAGLNLKLSIFLTARTFSCMNHLPEDAEVTRSPKSVFAFFFFLRAASTWWDGMGELEPWPSTVSSQMLHDLISRVLGAQYESWGWTHGEAVSSTS